MKTAMQQMIDILQRQINHLENTREKQGLSEMAKGALFTLQSRLIDAEELLEAEKEQIMEAYNFGYRDGFHDAQSGVSDEKDVSEFANSKQYYQQTFKSEQ